MHEHIVADFEVLMVHQSDARHATGQRCDYFLRLISSLLATPQHRIDPSTILRSQELSLNEPVEGLQVGRRCMGGGKKLRHRKIDFRT